MSSLTKQKTFVKGNVLLQVRRMAKKLNTLQNFQMNTENCSRGT